jgi:hypothetical protein
MRLRQTEHTALRRRIQCCNALRCNRKPISDWPLCVVPAQAKRPKRHKAFPGSVDSMKSIDYDDTAKMNSGGCKETRHR